MSVRANIPTRVRKASVQATIFFAVYAALLSHNVYAEDGYRLWLRYNKLESSSAATYRSQIKYLVVQGDSATMATVRDELKLGISGLLGTNLSFNWDVDPGGAVLAGTPKSSPLIARLKLETQLSSLGNEGYIIRSVNIKGQRVTVIA